jgi:hypothetical protein
LCLFYFLSWERKLEDSKLSLCEICGCRCVCFENSGIQISLTIPHESSRFPGNGRCVLNCFFLFYFFSFFLPKFCFSRPFAILFYHYEYFSCTSLLMPSLRFALFIYLFHFHSRFCIFPSYLRYPFTFVIFFLFWISYF